jgi:hypothetical protein
MATWILVKILEIVFASRKTTLKVVSNSSIEAAHGKGGLTTATYEFKDSSNDETITLQFDGVGIGLSVGPPTGASWSHADFPSWSSAVYDGPRPNWSSLKVGDLAGLGHIITVSAAIIGGVGQSLCLFNELIDGAVFEAVCMSEGISLGTPGAGVMCYKGVWRKV